MKIQHCFLSFLLLVSCSSPAVSPPPESAFQTINVYWSSNPENCSEVTAAARKVPKINDIEALALKTLFNGPTEAEKTQGFTSFFSEATGKLLLSFRVEGESAFVDLKDFRQIIPNVSASCGSMQFLAEMDSTIKQFGTYTKIIYSIEGNSQTFYEFLGLEVPE